MDHLDEKNNLLQVLGCGTGCGIYRVYRQTGDILFEDVFESADFSPEHGLMISGPQYSESELPLILVDVDTNEVLYDSHRNSCSTTLDVVTMINIF